LSSNLHYARPAANYNTGSLGCGWGEGGCAHMGVKRGCLGLFGAPWALGGRSEFVLAFVAWPSRAPLGPAETQIMPTSDRLGPKWGAHMAQ